MCIRDRHLLVRVELGEGVHQPHNPGRDQVFNVHMLGQALVNAAGQKAHDGQMLQQHPLLLAGENRQRRRRGRIAVAHNPAAQCAMIRNRIGRFHPHGIPSNAFKTDPVS